MYRDWLVPLAWTYIQLSLKVEYLQRNWLQAILMPVCVLCVLMVSSDYVKVESTYVLSVSMCSLAS
jgi:hypothetical protein